MKTKKKKYYLPLYEKWMASGEIGDWATCGLCSALASENKGQADDFFSIMEPTGDDMQELRNEGLSCTYWGSGLPVLHQDKHIGFTPLRQTLVLFLAALNDEL